MVRLEQGEYTFDYWCGRYIHHRDESWEYVWDLYMDYKCVAHMLNVDTTPAQESLMTYGQFFQHLIDMAKEYTFMHLRKISSYEYEKPRYAVQGFQLYHREYTNRERAVIGGYRIDPHDFSSPEA